MFRAENRLELELSRRDDLNQEIDSNLRSHFRLNLNLV